MERKKIIVLIFMLLGVASGSALIVYTGWAQSVVEFAKEFDFGPMMINEKKLYVLGWVNNTVTEKLILNTECHQGMETHQVIINNPLGSTKSVIELNLDGNTTINGVNQTLEKGEITLEVKAIKQGRWNCTIRVFNQSSTNIKFVDLLNITG